MTLERRRWLVVAAGILANLCSGSAYAFSVYAGPLEKLLQAGKPEVSVAFSLSMAFLPMGMLISGRMADRRSPGLVVLIGGGLFACGAFAAGFTNSLWWLYATYGAMMSLGNGASYGAAVSAAVRWFPERRGMAGGLVVSALGIGSLIIAPVAQAMIGNIGILGTFRVLGVAFMITIIIASRFIVNPPEDWALARHELADGDNSGYSRNVDWRAMLRRPLFWRLFVLYMLGTFSGLMVMSQAAHIARELAGASAAAAAVVVGLMGAANSAGRLLWGAASDRLGRFRALALMFSATALMMFLLASGGVGAWVLVPVLVLVALCYGGYLGVFPSICADAFGGLNLAVNYALLFAAFSAAGVLGPRVVAVLPYWQAFAVAGVVAVAGLVLALTTRIKSTES